MRQVGRLIRPYVPLFPAPDTTNTGGGNGQAVAQKAQE
jgi:hypothetical protein